MRGGQKHFIFDFYDCRARRQFFVERPMRKKIASIVKTAGATVRGTFFDSYGKDKGYTLFISIAESHVMVITWPELRLVNIDIFLCNFTRDNSMIARRIFSELKRLFLPKKIKKWEAKRAP